MLWEGIQRTILNPSTIINKLTTDHSGDFGNTNSADGSFALAVTVDGAAGHDTSTSQVSFPATSVQSSSVTSTSTAAPIISSIRTTALRSEGTATTKPFPTLQPSHSGSLSLYTGGVSAVATGTGISVQPTGSVISGAGGVSGLAPTVSGSGANGSWTFSKTGITIAPSLSRSQVLSEVSTRVETESSTHTTIVLDSTPRISPKKQISASSFHTYSTASKVSSGFLKSTTGPTVFTGSGTRVASQSSTWFIGVLLFFCLYNMYSV